MQLVERKGGYNQDSPLGWPKQRLVLYIYSKTRRSTRPGQKTDRGMAGLGSTGKITTKIDLLIQSQTLFTIVRLFL